MPSGASSQQGHSQDRPIKIGYLVSRYPAISHTFILREVLALRARGIQIEVASINDPPARETLTAEEMVEADRTFYVKRLGAAGACKSLLWMLMRNPMGVMAGLKSALQLGGTDLSRIGRCLFYFAEALILAQWMNKTGLIHLHVHFATPAATVAMLLAKTEPISFSITVHGPDEFYDVSAYSLQEKVQSALFVVCISHFAQSQLMKLTPQTDWSKFDIARLGVDCEKFLPSESQPREGAFRILCVGRLVSTKGQRILLDAVEQLIQEGRLVELCFIGDGPDRNILQNVVEQRGRTHQISFAGAVNQDHIQSYYDSTDVFALASFAEGIPVVLMEAMAKQIPCVSTAINGIPELIRDGVDGILVAPSDRDGLTAALRRLMDDPDLRSRLGSAGRQRVLEHYELSRSADTLAAIFSRRIEPTA